MDWTCVREDGIITEWERQDTYATVRIREHPSGECVVRLDVMEQAVDERTYERKVVADREAALEQAADWRAERALTD